MQCTMSWGGLCRNVSIIAVARERLQKLRAGTKTPPSSSHQQVNEKPTCFAAAFAALDTASPAAAAPAATAGGTCTFRSSLLLLLLLPPPLLLLLAGLLALLPGSASAGLLCAVASLLVSPLVLSMRFCSGPCQCKLLLLPLV
jgi:hypothetical protein